MEFSFLTKENIIKLWKRIPTKRNRCYHVYNFVEFDTKNYIYRCFKCHKELSMSSYEREVWKKEMVEREKSLKDEDMYY